MAEVTHFTGKAGTLYVERVKESGAEVFQVWFEDHCILGTGSSLSEALKNAERMAGELRDLARQAVSQTTKVEKKDKRKPLLDR